MAYDTEKLYQKALKASKQKGVHFIQDVIALTGVSKDTFYNHFPIDSDESYTINNNLSENRIATKIDIRKKLGKSGRAAELIALYKLLATPEERKALSMQHVDHTTDGDKIGTFSGMSTEDLTKIDDIRKKYEDDNK